jgi:membrane-bound lytic murein transglycosylase A
VQRPGIEELNRIVAKHFRVYRAAGLSGDNAVLYTGYYEPILKGSLIPTAEYKVPLFTRPADLIEIDLTPFAADLKGRRIVGRFNGRTVKPYPQRAAIRSGKDFQHLAPPVAWVREEFDLFNLQVQGSGKVVLPDGSMLHIHYDGSNGHPYRSIGRLLITQGKIPSDQLSMQAIRTYLRDHPDELHEIVNHNPRYIFFRRVEQGPIGALGVPLTPQRSIAVDRTLFPMAALAFISTDVPRVKDLSGHNDHGEQSDRGDRGVVAGQVHYSGFALAQDTGSAITGSGRADFFWGSGLLAEAAAGHMKYPGQLFFMVLDPGSDMILP